MVAAYEALSETLRGFINGLEAVHSFHGRSMAGREQDLGYGKLAREQDGLPRVGQPVVRRDPGTGRKSLYVNPMFTESIMGLGDDESDTLLSLLYRHSIRPEFTLRLRWRVGTTVVWDNTTTMHYPLNDYAGYRQIMHRVVIAGDQATGRPL